MRNLLILLIFVLFLLPVREAESGERHTYIAKTEKSVRSKKKIKRSRRPVRHPVRVNTSISAEEVKINQMLKDIYE